MIRVRRVEELAALPARSQYVTRRPVAGSPLVTLDPDGLTAEQRLARLGVPFEEPDSADALDPELGGCLLARPVDDGVQVKVVIRPELPGWQRVTFAEWAESRFMRFIEHGPEPDGWQKRPDGDWQLCGRLTQMPFLDQAPGTAPPAPGS
jgi:hypothetical protein